MNPGDIEAAERWGRCWKAAAHRYQQLAANAYETGQLLRGHSAADDVAYITALLFRRYQRCLERKVEAERKLAELRGPVFFCCDDKCPGRPYRASQRAHPLPCGEPVGFDDDPPTAEENDTLRQLLQAALMWLDDVPGAESLCERIAAFGGARRAIDDDTPDDDGECNPIPSKARPNGY